VKEMTNYYLRLARYFLSAAALIAFGLNTDN
jgi:hypothetical protein